MNFDIAKQHQPFFLVAAITACHPLLHENVAGILENL
jgi:hypothetical protein